MNDGGGNVANCDGIEVRMDTTKLSNVVTAGCGDGRNLVEEGTMFTKYEAKVASKVGGVK